MAWRLYKLSIENFKAFPTAQTLVLDGKNLLLYGQNGSGKSSFFWALYTLYFSRYKDSQVKVNKYFDRANDENLLNRYTHTGSGYVQADFHNDDTDGDKTILVSDSNQDIVGARDSFIEATTTFSDFLNYQKNTSLFDYCNSEENDVFPAFARDIFPFLKFQRKCTKLDGTTTESERASEWWDYIEQASKSELLAADGSFLPDDDQKYSDFQIILNGFNTYLSTSLQAIKAKTDSILHDVDKLNLPNVELFFSLSDVTYNNIVPGTTVHDHSIRPGKIIVTAKDTNTSNPANQLIKRPRTYFNEATLSKIALAIRLAVFELKASFMADEGSKLLFVDDLLISFDMVNRMEIAEFLLSYAKDYQMIIFTHDKSFYNLMSSQIENKENWIFKDLYMDSVSVGGQTVPRPRICDRQSNMEMAEEYFSLGDNIACAVYLRRETERILKGILEQRYLDNEDVVTGKKFSKDLSELISQLPSALSEYKITYSNKKLQILRSNVMNISAHDNAELPIYRTELQKAIDEVRKLREFKRAVLCSNNEIGVKQFNFRLSNGTESISISFVYNQTASRLTDASGQNYYQNNIIQIKKIKSKGILVWDFVRKGGCYRLCDLFDRVSIHIGLSLVMEDEIRACDGMKKIKDF